MNNNMSNKNYDNVHNCKTHSNKRPSSFHLIDSNKIFKEVNIKSGNYLLDLGCGVGEYSVLASEYVGNSGFVYALDVQENIIKNLNEIIKNKKLKNIKALTTDILKPLPLQDNTIDICLIITVLHSINIENNGPNLFKEVFRILKPKGRLITIDCKKEKTDFGPPFDMKISPEKLENIVLKQGFNKLKIEYFRHFYMYQFLVKK